MREYESNNVIALKAVAQTLFKLLGIVCLTVDSSTGKPTELQESFFDLAIGYFEKTVPIDVPFNALLNQNLTEVCVISNNSLLP